MYSLSLLKPYRRRPTIGYVILRSSGKSVKQWINDRIILEAKVLLNEPDQSILQISESLGFPNQSAFGTYFKKITTLSPLNYRKALSTPPQTPQPDNNKKRL